MRFLHHSLIKIILSLIIFTAISTVYPTTSMALANASQTFTTHNMRESAHLGSIEKSSSGAYYQVNNFTPLVKPETCIPSCGSGDLRYDNNGPVQLQPQAYLIFWGSYWKNSSGTAESGVV